MQKKLQQYVFGFNRELKLPWRRMLGPRSTGDEEVTEKFEPQKVEVDPELKSEDRPMIATWQDGMEKIFGELKYGWWQELKNEKKKRKDGATETMQVGRKGTQ